MTTAADSLQRQLDECRERLQQRERELAMVSLELERLGGLHAAFVRRMAHDLRAPMNAIMGYARLLQRRAGPALDERQHRNIENLQASAGQLLGLIEDVAELARAEGGRAPMCRREVDVASLADECLAAAAARLGTRVTLHRQIDGAPRAHTDPQRLQAAIEGLLLHAAGDGRGGCLLFQVREADAGVEIAVVAPCPAAAAAQTPDPLPAGAPIAGCPRLGGVRRLLEMLGATLSVARAQGLGTTFSVLLPASGA